MYLHGLDALTHVNAPHALELRHPHNVRPQCLDFLLGIDTPHFYGIPAPRQGDLRHRRPRLPLNHHLMTDDFPNPFLTHNAPAILLNQPLTNQCVRL